jgi:hypothetical protein
MEKNNREVVVNNLPPWVRAKAMEADSLAEIEYQLARFHYLLARAKNFARPIDDGIKFKPAGETPVATSANFITHRRLVLTIEGVECELDFFIYAPRSSNYNPSLTATWHEIGTDFGVLDQAYVSQRHFNNNHPAFDPTVSETLDKIEKALTDYERAPDIAEITEPPDL